MNLTEIKTLIPQRMGNNNDSTLPALIEIEVRYVQDELEKEIELPWILWNSGFIGVGVGQAVFQPANSASAVSFTSLAESGTVTALSGDGDSTILLDVSGTFTTTGVGPGGQVTHQGQASSVKAYANNILYLDDPLPITNGETYVVNKADENVWELAQLNRFIRRREGVPFYWIADSEKIHEKVALLEGRYDELKAYYGNTPGTPVAMCKVPENPFTYRLFPTPDAAGTIEVTGFFKEPPLWSTGLVNLNNRWTLEAGEVLLNSVGYKIASFYTQFQAYISLFEKEMIKFKRHLRDVTIEREEEFLSNTRGGRED